MSRGGRRRRQIRWDHLAAIVTMGTRRQRHQQRDAGESRELPFHAPRHKPFSSLVRVDRSADAG